MTIPHASQKREDLTHTAPSTRVAVIAAGILLVVFALLAMAVVRGWTTRFDEAVLLGLRTAGDPTNPIGPPWLEEMGRDITSVGSLAFLVFVSVVSIGYLLLTKRHGYAYRVIIALVGGEVISTSLKMLFDRARPGISPIARVFTASFPSGHAMLSAVTFLTLGALVAKASPDPSLKRYVMGVAIFMTLMVGLSRIYLGVHFPSDVLAGWCLGSAWALLCWAGFQSLERSR